MRRHNTPSSFCQASELTHWCGDKLVHYDQVWILDGLIRSPNLNRRAVRICRPAAAGEGHSGRVLVECLIDSLRVFVKGANLCAATEDERRLLSKDEQTSLQMFDFANQNRIGVDTSTGCVLFTTDPDS
jgi:hypothetical protein